jgi:hypothetical protein
MLFSINKGLLRYRLDLQAHDFDDDINVNEYDEDYL